MAKPALSDDRDIFIQIRASRKEREQLAKIAEYRGVSSSDVIRTWIKRNAIK